MYTCLLLGCKEIMSCFRMAYNFKEIEAANCDKYNNTYDFRFRVENI